MTVSLLPSRTAPAHATFGLDLSGFGAAPPDEHLVRDLPVARADLARLASCTRAAHDAGVDLVTLGETFRLRSDSAARTDAWLDPVTAARRIGPYAGSGGLVPVVPARPDPASVASGLAGVTSAGTAWAGVQVTGEAAAVGRGLEELRRCLRGTPPRVVVEVRTEDDVAVAGAHADVVRIREQDLRWARELRYAVRAAARAAGRGEVVVLADLHAVVSPDRAAALDRAALVATIAGTRAPWAGALQAVGTVPDVADTVEEWLAAGSADGFVVLPGSVPADVAALLHGVLPELRHRGIVRAVPAPPVRRQVLQKSTVA